MHITFLFHAHVVLMILLCVYRKIRETLNNLILRSPQDWQTNVALPFVSACDSNPLTSDQENSEQKFRGSWSPKHDKIYDGWCNSKTR